MNITKEQQARELLAAEYDDWCPEDAALIREGATNNAWGMALRAIVAALEQRDALVAEYERACGIKGEGYVHALMHIFNAITNAQVDAKVAALSQQQGGA